MQRSSILLLGVLVIFGCLVFVTGCQTTQPYTLNQSGYPSSLYISKDGVPDRAEISENRWDIGATVPVDVISKEVKDEMRREKLLTWILPLGILLGVGILIFLGRSGFNKDKRSGA